MPLIPGIERQRWADWCELQVSLVYVERSTVASGIWRELVSNTTAKQGRRRVNKLKVLTL